MRTKLLLSVSAILFSVASFAQSACGFDEVHRQKLKTDPLYVKSVDENEKKIQQYIARNKASLTARTTGTSAATYIIPVVVHVMHTGGAVGTTYNPSDVQIRDAITYLNQVYNGTYPGTQGIGDIQVQFALAVKDPNCNSTSGINRVDASSVSGYSDNGISTNPGTNPGVNELNVKNLARWSPLQYYNIWIVNKINGQDGTSGTFTAGYAYFPGAPQAYDGTVMLATQMQSGRKTLPHEIGHAFGLYHTFEGSNSSSSCPANTDCNANGDRVCDTDPITYNETNGVFSFACRTGTNTCTGTEYSINTENNYMSYTTCYTLFTAGQKARILANAAGAFRRSLSTSPVLNAAPSVVTFSAPSAATCTPTTSSTGLSNHYAGIIDVEFNNRNLGSTTTRNDGGYVNGAISCLNLVPLTRGATYPFTVRVYGLNDEQVRAWIDYNNDGQFDNATEQIHINNYVTTGSTSGSFTVPATATLNTVLRMRIISELTTDYGMAAISSACFNPTYGQAEDYPVYIQAATLPVTLVNFEGAIRHSSAQLSWTTSSSQGLRDFEVEKSSDGIAYRKIGTVTAVNGSITRRYAFEDRQIAETNFYRLRINEAGGASRFSAVVQLRNTREGHPVRIVNNPFQGTIEMNFSTPARQVRLQLINTTGALVAEKEMLSVQGNTKWYLPGTVSSGNYLLMVIADGEVFTSKVVKQ